MTVEQKAKAYDEALERAKKEWSNNLDGAYKNYREHLEFIFPELKMNKKEWIEKIRQELRSYLGNREVKQISESDAILQWIAWIEKQGEHHIACNEEQLKVLNEVLNFAANHESHYWNDYIFGTLNSLLKQLKKLKV